MTSHPVAAGTGHILVVDDQASNRELFRDLLEAGGHRVSLASDGLEGIRLAHETSPDVILLDVSMPGIDGLEACRRLKADPVTTVIPVLLVTALAHREHRLAGVEAGANDYITKPIDSADLVLRVRNALHVRSLYKEVSARYERLKDLESLRDSLVHMLVHDLRTPLLGIRLYLELLRDGTRTPTSAEELEELVGEAENVTTRMTDMVNDLLDASRLEGGAMPLERKPADLVAITVEAVGTVTARGHGGHVEVSGATSLQVDVDTGVILRVLVNLIRNAVDFSPKERPVQVRVTENGTGAHVEVQDDGPGIPAEYHEKIFEKFGQVDAARKHVVHSSGLGLTFCRLAVQAHGGAIGVKSEVGHGSTFWFSVPKTA